MDYCPSQAVYVFIDTEFTSLSDPQLIAIGAVGEHGERFHAERSDFPRRACTAFGDGRSVGAGLGSDREARAFRGADRIRQHRRQARGFRRCGHATCARADAAESGQRHGKHVLPGRCPILLRPIFRRGREFSVFDHYDQADAAQVARLSAGSMSASLWRPGIGPYCCGDLRDALMHGQAAVGGASLFLRSARETDVDRLAAIMHRLGHQCGWMIGVLGWADLTMEELADWLELWPGMLPDDILPSTAFALVPEAHLHLPDRESSALVLSWETVGESPVLTTMSDLHRMGSVSCLVESEIFR
jgi:hypothetical protein